MSKAGTKTLTEMSVENYKNGFSCSESIIKAGVDSGLCDESLIDVATSFSGGMASGCVCGAIAGAQMLLGNEHGRNKTGMARQKAGKFIHEFTKTHKATCCRILRKGLEIGSPEHKAHCAKLVEASCEILEDLI